MSKTYPVVYHKGFAYVMESLKTKINVMMFELALCHFYQGWELHKDEYVAPNCGVRRKILATNNPALLKMGAIQHGYTYPTLSIAIPDKNLRAVTLEVESYRDRWDGGAVWSSYIEETPEHLIVRRVRPKQTNKHNDRYKSEEVIVKRYFYE